MIDGMVEEHLEGVWISFLSFLVDHISLWPAPREALDRPMMVYLASWLLAGVGIEAGCGVVANLIIEAGIIVSFQDDTQDFLLRCRLGYCSSVWRLSISFSFLLRMIPQGCLHCCGLEGYYLSASHSSLLCHRHDACLHLWRSLSEFTQ